MKTFFEADKKPVATLVVGLDTEIAAVLRRIDPKLSEDLFQGFPI